MLTTYRPSKDNRQLFNDGVLRGVSIKGSAIKENTTADCPFGDCVVGLARTYREKGEDTAISRQVVVPHGLAEWDEIDRVEICSYRSREKARYYRILQVQQLPDNAPPAVRLVLDQIKTRFADERKTDGTDD